MRRPGRERYLPGGDAGSEDDRAQPQPISLDSGRRIGSDDLNTYADLFDDHLDLVPDALDDARTLSFD